MQGMDYVFLLLGVAILVFLGFIWVELRRTFVVLRRIAGYPRGGQDVKQASPSVVVNVGTISPTPPVKTDPEPSATGNPAPDPLPEIAEPEPEAEAPRPQEKPYVRAATLFAKPSNTGGVGVLKCPHCGAENTSFRTECFQCGRSLF